jgi:hypothetical protein
MKNSTTSHIRRALAAGLLLSAAPSCLNADFAYSGMLNMPTSSWKNRIYVDLDGGTAATASFSGYDVMFDFFMSNTEYPELTKSTSNGWYCMDSSTFLARYSLNDAIPVSGGTAASTYLLDYDSSGQWNSNNSGTVTGYACLYHSSGEVDYTAWIQLSWNDATNTLTLIDFASDSTATMLVGQTTAPVPEPAATAAMAALATLGVAAVARRRKIGNFV